MSAGAVIVEHIDGADAQWIEEELDRRGIPHGRIQTFAGDTLPDEPDVIIVLGGPQSAYALDDDPYLRTEVDWLREQVDEGTPTLAICLGSQLLSVALGGEAGPGASGLEHGFVDVRRTEAPHPLGDAIGGRFFVFHTDACVPPAGATVLAVSDRYQQAWSLGPALAVQFHPELSPEGVAQLISHEEVKLRSAGIDTDAMLAEVFAAEDASREAAAALIGGWLDLHARTPR